MNEYKCIKTICLHEEPTKKTMKRFTKDRN